ncbi:MAG: dicarboxylate/amino acid:cation symporter, partial [Gammaproteobacteria bacterium]|nr:dicarboxylate/amino acid:cation symporter [Gammaproteobacteria bacterium]
MLIGRGPQLDETRSRPPRCRRDEPTRLSPRPSIPSSEQIPMEYNPDLPFYRRLHWQVLAAMILGSLAGVTFGEAGAEAIGWIGELFMRLLRMIIVPLVLTSIVSGVASVGGGRAVGRLFGKTLGYYVVSSFLAASVGLLMVNLYRPGVGSNIVEASTGTMRWDAPESFIRVVLGRLP